MCLSSSGSRGSSERCAGPQGYPGACCRLSVHAACRSEVLCCLLSSTLLQRAFLSLRKPSPRMAHGTLRICVRCWQGYQQLLGGQGEQKGLSVMHRPRSTGFASVLKSCNFVPNLVSRAICLICIYFTHFHFIIKQLSVC